MAFMSREICVGDKCLTGMTQHVDQIRVVDLLPRLEGGASSCLRVEVELESEQGDCYNKSDLEPGETWVLEPGSQTYIRLPV
jgi:hypothetical protein